MHLHILKIILWPRRPGFHPRIVDFIPTSINVISGGSKTGKSAIIPIIDYCLAADRCSIPVDVIRNACSWFGILIDTVEGQKLLARREPGDQQSTSGMYIREMLPIEIPDVIEKENINTTAVKRRLDELCGLTTLNMVTQAEGVGYKGRPSFRDLMAFTFQPQNIIANQGVLFFKADTVEHREKLKSIFPYVLNAVTAKVLVAQHELELVRRTIDRKDRELRNLRNLSERWSAELRALAVQAREMGLIEVRIADNATREDLLDILQEAVRHSPVGKKSSEGISEAMKELASLEEEEREINKAIRSLRQRLGEMTKLRATIEKYGSSLTIQRDRLAISKWLLALEDSTHKCPICESEMDEPTRKLNELYASLQSIEKDLHGKKSIPTSFDREFIHVKRDLDDQVEKMRGVSIRRSAIEFRSEEAKQIGFRDADSNRFVGRLEKSLELLGEVGDDGGLARELEGLRERERELNRIISAGSVKRKAELALERIALFAGRLLPLLDCERPSDPIELSLTELTIKAKGEDREDFLWEIGSGANWLSYHLAMSLALQQFFIESEHSPVPSFLVYDQPSQVYFPRRTSSASPPNDPAFVDEDIVAVRKAFETISKAVADTKYRLQVIVLDHAGEDVWGQVETIHLVEEWRDGKKLVPREWYSDVDSVPSPEESEALSEPPEENVDEMKEDDDDDEPGPWVLF